MGRRGKKNKVLEEAEDDDIQHDIYNMINSG